MSILFLRARISDFASFIFVLYVYLSSEKKKLLFISWRDAEDGRRIFTTTRLQNYTSREKMIILIPRFGTNLGSVWSVLYSRISRIFGKLFIFIINLLSFTIKELFYLFFTTTSSTLLFKESFILVHIFIYFITYTCQACFFPLTHSFILSISFCMWSGFTAAWASFVTIFKLVFIFSLLF